MTRPTHLPDYSAPPIDEVAIGVQFPPVNGLSEPYIGLFWSKIRDEYPRVETQGRIEGPIESLSDTPTPVLQLQFGPPVGRTWYLSENDSSLVQVQDTRFIQNWRRRGSEYPHFDHVKDKFWKSFGLFRELLDDESKPLPTVQQLELTYINWITDIPVAQFLNVAGGAKVQVEDVIGEPEAQDWTGRFLVQNDDVPTARLYVQCQRMNRLSPPVTGPGYQLSLVYRAPYLQGMSDAMLEEQMINGQRIIVQTFTELTTQFAHEKWGRIQ